MQKCTSQYGASNYPLSCSAEYGQHWKIEEIRGYLSPRYREGNTNIRRNQREWRAEKCNPCVVAQSVLPSTGLQTTRFHAAPNMADSENLRKFRATFSQGTDFAPREYLYQKEATGMENLKM